MKFLKLLLTCRISSNIFLNTTRRTYCNEIKPNTSFRYTWEEPNGFNTGVKIYNEAFKEKVPLILINKGKVTWYSCGPTVYAEAHIGHASCYVKFDIIRRILNHLCGMDVIMLMGVTDIDDKIIMKANKENCCVKDISQKYENEFFSDLKSLNVQPPSLVTRVTDYIPEIITFIKKLIDQNNSYVTSEGNVYFRVTSYSKEPDPEFSKTIDPLKENYCDFALWKAAKNNEPFWDSPWGKGRPGWHIECSAMASHVFGSKIDIHSGGYDLWHPHHTNEQLQSEAYHDQKQWVNYWIHAGLLTFENDTKMSKSLGNVLTIKNYLKDHSANLFRIICLLCYYRCNIEYSEETIELAKSAFLKLHHFLNDAELCIAGELQCQGLDSDILYEKLHWTRENVSNTLLDDFNTNQALKYISNLIDELNKLFKPVHNDQFNKNITVLSEIYNYVNQILELLGVNIITKQKLPIVYVNIVNSIVQFRHNIRTNALCHNEPQTSGFNINLLKHVNILKEDLLPYNIQCNDCDWFFTSNADSTLEKYLLNDLTKILTCLSEFHKTVLKFELRFLNNGKTMKTEYLKESDNFRSELHRNGICIKDTKIKSAWYPLETSL